MLIKNKGAAAAFVRLVALAALAVAYSYFGPTKNDQYRKPASTPKDESVQDVSAETVAYYTEVLAWFTGILAFVSFGQGFLLLKADKTAGKAAAAAQQSAAVAEKSLTDLERPYVFVTGVNNLIGRMLERNSIRVEYIVANYGRAPAIIHRVNAGFSCAPEAIPGRTDQGHPLVISPILSYNDPIGPISYWMTEAEYREIDLVGPMYDRPVRKFFFRVIITYDGPIPRRFETSSTWEFIGRDRNFLLAEDEKYTYRR